MEKSVYIGRKVAYKLCPVWNEDEFIYNSFWSCFFYKQDIFLEIKSFEGPSITFLLLQQEITKNEMANIT